MYPNLILLETNSITQNCEQNVKAVFFVSFGTAFTYQSTLQRGVFTIERSLTMSALLLNQIIPRLK